MVGLLLVALMQGAASAPVDSVYSTAAVRQLVERASVANRRVPDALRGYRARVESEMAFIARQPDGTEQTFTVEQTASTVRWDRSGRFEQRVIGYRSQSVGVTMSAVGMFRQAWAVPILYGNRITLLFGLQDSTRRNSPGRAAAPMSSSQCIHSRTTAPKCIAFPGRHRCDAQTWWARDPYRPRSRRAARRSPNAANRHVSR
jgi:hypothetical protein